MINEAFAGMLPLQGSEIAARWDGLYSFMLWISVFFFVLVVGAMFYFIFAYKHRPGVKTQYITGNHLLEAVWIAVPTLLLLVIFGWGYSVYHAMTQAPSDAYEIRVIGKQWLWNFQYDNGKVTTGEVFVPVNKPVKLIMTSEDVLHSFFVPNFRIKQDVVPGLYSSVWFTATVPGKHQVFCAEYCGTAHSGMLAKIVALTDEQWRAWNLGKTLGEIPEAGNEGAPQISSQEDSAVRVVATQVSPLAEKGKALYERACATCHSVDGSIKVGPSHKGLFGRKVELANGSVVVADENYIRNKMERPRESTVKGFGEMMPTFKGLFSATEMNELLAYIKSLR